MKLTDFKNFFEKIKHKNVYVGFSGGSDSRFILELATFFQKKFKYNLTAINFEHGIRGEESVQDSQFCIDTCNNLQIPIQSISLNLSADMKNIESIAREKRLEYYSEIANKDPNHIILLGHHLDDKFENFFLRLARGSNLTGLTSLKEFNYIGNIYIGRPLLNYNKADILQYMKENSIEYRTDSTNFDSDYGRNYLRNIILPNWFEKFKFAKGGLKQAIKHIEEDSDFIESFTENKFEHVYKNWKLGIPVSIQFYLGLHSAIRFRVLKKHIQLYIPDYEMTNALSREFSAMINAYDNTDHKTLKLNNNWKIVIKGYKIFIENF